MRRFWAAFGLLIAMLGLTVFNAWYMGEITGSVSGRLVAAEEMAARDGWEQAEEMTRQCFADWEAHHAYLHIVSRHSDTDAILISFREVLRYITLEEMDQYAAQNRELITQIELLAEMERPDWLNIL